MHTHRDDPIPELKRQAAEALVKELDGWNSHFMAATIGTDQPRISDIRRGRLHRFSLETLIRYLTRLSQRVELHITRAPPKPVQRPRNAPPCCAATGPDPDDEFDPDDEGITL